MIGDNIPLSPYPHPEQVTLPRYIKVRHPDPVFERLAKRYSFDEQELEAGDHIVIGPVVFTIQIDGEPEDVRPVRTRLEARKPAATAAADTEESDVLSANDLFGEEEDPISELEALGARVSVVGTRG